MDKETKARLKKGIDKVREVIKEQKPTLDKLRKQETVTSEELDKFYSACNPERDYKRRRDLQNRYEFLKPTNLMGGIMAFGFECGDGWLPILEDLFADIDEAAKRDGLACFRVVQVKEKFGGLRVYADNGSDATENLIKEAENLAWMTCERCGQAGKLRRSASGWFKTLCDACCKPRHKR